ncbi:MAG: hypothetical protein JWM33_2773, partial [Caulobacteraceae bacterium]|nr:hypothetical protein [Caulobacteraceae bacterium]
GGGRAPVCQDPNTSSDAKPIVMPGKCDSDTGILIPDAPVSLVLPPTRAKTDYTSPYVEGDSVRNAQGVMFGSISKVNLDGGKVVSLDMRTATGEVRRMPVDAVKVGNGLPWEVTSLTADQINALPLAPPAPVASTAATDAALATGTGTVAMTAADCKAAFDAKVAAANPAGAGAPAAAGARGGAAAGAAAGAAGGRGAGGAGGGGRGN